MPTGARGHTLVELVVVCAIMATIAGITVPSVMVSQARASGYAAARDFAVVLRQAQARASASGDVVRVSVDADGRGYRVETVTAAGGRQIESGDFGTVTCRTNYPGNAVEFAGPGWPRAVGSGVRAGTFTLSTWGCSRAVVLQMGGVIRCR